MSRKVMAFGTFDLLHPGHLKYLEEASRHGDYLIVVIARDSSVLALKGKLPIVKEKSRATMVGALSIVDKAMVGNRISRPDDIFKVIKQNKPNVLVFGYDQRVNIEKLKEWLKKNSMKVKIVRIKRGYKTESYKSSKIREKMISL